MALITCRDLALSYDGKTVVSGLNFDICAGSYVCILGENGTGKSTLMRALLGLKRPEHGTIAYGEGFSHGSAGYLPQQSAIQRDFPASVSEVVRSGCLRGGLFRPFYPRAEKARADANMDRLHILPLRKRCYRDLSGGQQQRVLLARALCAASHVLFLDEPAAGLDPVVTADFYRLIAQLNGEGMTIVMVSHDVAAALRYATHILLIKHRQLFWGTRDDYVNSEFGRNLPGGESDV